MRGEELEIDLSTVLEPTEKRVLADDVASRLRGAILHGHFAPGERLREERLAQALGVSRGPVREALTELERQGLVVIFRNRGAVVAQLSAEDLEELYTLRLAIEVLAVRRAARLASEEEIARLAAIVDEIAVMLYQGISESAAAELDLEFHDLIYAAARHRRLQETWANMRSQIHILLLSRNVANWDFRELVLTSHADIMNAIRDRDEDRAAATIEEHLAGSYERVARSVSEREASKSREEGLDKLQL
ncbi:GntR family transcriptional regulator [soil metagenome]